MGPFDINTQYGGVPELLASLRGMANYNLSQLYPFNPFFGHPYESAEKSNQENANKYKELPWHRL